MTWNTDNSRAASRPATAITTISVSQPPIQPAARAIEASEAACIARSVADRLRCDLSRWEAHCIAAGYHRPTTIACSSPSATSRRPRLRQTAGANKLRHQPQPSWPGRQRCRRVEPWVHGPTGGASGGPCGGLEERRTEQPRPSDHAGLTQANRPPRKPGRFRLTARRYWFHRLWIGKPPDRRSQVPRGAHTSMEFRAQLQAHASSDMTPACQGRAVARHSLSEASHG